MAANIKLFFVEKYHFKQMSITNNNRMKVMLFFILVICPCVLCAENSSITIGINSALKSSILNEERPLQIYTPKSYHPKGSKHYPVIYLLDGDAHFIHTVGIIDFLSSQNRMPESILVSILNTNRKRDLTPKPVIAEKYYPTAGGADDFLAFIQEELIPYIDSTYNTNNHRTLIGHSIAGLFTIYTLITKPDAFSNYIAISPSLWWDNNSIIEKMNLFLEQSSLPNKRLYMTIGNEAGGHIGDRYLTSVRDLSNVLEENAPKSFHWTFKHMPNESHGSIPHRTIYNGFEEIYKGWDFGDIYTFLRNEDIASIDNHFERLSKTYEFKVETPSDVIDQFGYRFLKNKKFDKAIEMYIRNVNNDPNSAYAYDNLGAAYEKNGQLELAYSAYKQATQLSNKYSDPQKAVYAENFKRLEKRHSIKK